jgi:hypothetical protein
MNKNIFKFSDKEFENLHSSLQNEFRPTFAKNYLDKIEELMLIADRELHINEIQVGLYKKYSIFKSRHILSNTLHVSAKRGGIIQSGENKGFYELKRKDK